MAPNTLSRIAGVFHRDGYPGPSPEDVTVAFDGRLDNRQQLTVELAERDSTPAPPDSELALAAYKRYGDEFASRLAGDFIVAIADGGRRQLVLARDLMGSRRLYYCEVGRTVLFASEIKTLLSDPRVTAHPNDPAVIDIVLDDWDDGHETCFTGIYGVRPGHVVVAGTGRIVSRPHSVFNPSAQTRYPSADDYVDRFRSLFADAVSRRLQHETPVAMMVSGGLDSSSIFCQAGALASSGRTGASLRGFSMTFPGDSTADETDWLDAVDGRFAIPITRLPHKEIRLLTRADATVAAIEAPGFAWDAQHHLFECAARAGCSVILDGHFGDQMLFPRRYLIDLIRSGRFGMAVSHVREFGRWMTDVDPAVFSDELTRELRRSFVPAPIFQAVKRALRARRARQYPAWYRREHVTALLERQIDRFDPGRRASSCHASEYHHHATAGYYRAQTHHQTALGRMHGLDVRYPFRDRDLVAFLMSIPGEVVNRGGVPKGLLRAAMSGTLPDAVRDRRSKADFTMLANRGVVNDYEGIARLMTRDCAAVRAGFLEPRALVELMSSFKGRIADARDAVSGWQAMRLAGLELWLRHFFPSRYGLPCTTS